MGPCNRCPEAQVDTGNWFYDERSNIVVPAVVDQGLWLRLSMVPLLIFLLGVSRARSWPTVDNGANHLGPNNKPQTKGASGHNADSQRQGIPEGNARNEQHGLPPLQQGT